MMRAPEHARPVHEQGMALIAVLLLLMTMSALAAALAISGNTETLIARNHETAAQARAAAEAGLSHALQVVIEEIQDWETNMHASPSAAMTALLADDGSLEDLGIDDDGENLAGLSDVTYEARVLDDDDPDRGWTPSPAELLLMSEDGDEDADANTRLVVRAIGYASGNAVATVEATIVPLELPAILTDGDLEIDGSFGLSGTDGDMHTNSDLEINGNAAAVTPPGTCSSTGDTDGAPNTGACSEGEAEITVPTFEASDYLSRADYILNNDGTYTDVSTNTQTTCANPCLGAWRWASGSNEWQITAAGGNPSPSAATYYIDDPDVTVRISGSPGSVAIPVQMSLIAEGSIIISGGPTIEPDTSGVLFVTDEDLSISGGLTVTEEGLMLVGEQLGISGGGNKVLRGQILVADAAANSSVETANVINGNVSIIYNGGLDDMFFTVSAWRRD